MVSNAAESSRRQRQESFCEPSIDEMVVNVRENSFSGMVFRVSRLMRIKGIV